MDKNELFGIETYFFNSNKWLINMKVDIEPAQETPLHIQSEIEAQWQTVIEKNPSATDGQILFLKKVESSEDNTTFITEIGGFSKTAYFNRNPSNYDKKEELIEANGLSLSGHVHILSKDNKFIFGTKKNQFNQISGFGGFPQQNDYDVIYNRISVNIPAYINRSLRGEIGNLVEEIEGISAVGFTFVDALKLRGTDIDYYVKVNKNAKSIAENFEENSQFTRKTYVVENDPNEIKNFIKNQFSEGRTISPYALGAASAIQYAIHGDEALSLVKGAIENIPLPYKGTILEGIIQTRDLV